MAIILIRAFILITRLFQILPVVKIHEYKSSRQSEILHLNLARWVKLYLTLKVVGDLLKMNIFTFKNSRRYCCCCCPYRGSGSNLCPLSYLLSLFLFRYSSVFSTDSSSTDTSLTASSSTGSSSTASSTAASSTTSSSTSSFSTSTS